MSRAVNDSAGLPRASPMAMPRKQPRTLSCRSIANKPLPSTRVRHAADEQDAVRARMADQEQERVVGAKDDRLRLPNRHPAAEHHVRHGSGLGPLLVDLDVSPVPRLRDEEFPIAADA